MEIDRSLSFQNFHERSANILRQSECYEVGKMTINIPTVIVSSATVHTIDIDFSEALNPWVQWLLEQASFDDAGLNFPSFIITNALLSPQQIQNRILSHVSIGAGRHFVRLWSGLSITGNIHRLVNDFSMGFNELFNFFSFRHFHAHFVGGISNYMANVIDQVGIGIDGLTDDLQSQQRRLQLRRSEMSGRERVKASLNAFTDGIRRNINDLISPPSEGRRNRSARQTLRWIGRGTIRLLAAPFTGCLSCMADLCRAAHDEAAAYFNADQEIKNLILPKRRRRILPATGVIPDFK